MGVDRAAEVLGAAAVFHVRDHLADDFARVVTEDLRAEDPVGRGVGDDFHEAVGRVHGDGAAVGGEVEFADLDGAAGGLGGVLAEADGGDFRLGVNDAGHQIPVYMAGLAGDPLGDGNAVLLGLVGEHRAGDNVADGPDVLDGGAEVVVDLDAFLFIELHAGFLKAETVGVGPAADGDEDLVRRKFKSLSVTFGHQGCGEHFRF